METIENGCIGWDEEINDSEKQFILLEEGDYNFTVSNFSKEMFPGSAKIPQCNKAVFQLDVESKEGHAYVTHDLIMHKSLEWKLSSFFRAIGQKKPGESLKPRWNEVVGSSGRAHIVKTTYTNKSGQTKEKNEVQRFYDYDPMDHKDDVPFFASKPEPQQTKPSTTSWKQNGGF